MDRAKFVRLMNERGLSRWQAEFLIRMASSGPDALRRPWTPVELRTVRLIYAMRWGDRETEEGS